MIRLQFKNSKNTSAHYVSAVIPPSGNTIYISGQLPIDPQTREKSSGNIKEQTLMALGNVEKIIQTVGGDRKNIVKTTAYIKGIENWEDVNKAYAEFFGEFKQARSIISVVEIHFGLLVEIEAIAVI